MDLLVLLQYVLANNLRSDEFEMLQGYPSYPIECGKVQYCVGNLAQRIGVCSGFVCDG
jgi:hypothetical protein